MPSSLPAPSWSGFPLDPLLGEAPFPKDTPPTRTREGYFIFYHGTSRWAAQIIRQTLLLVPDDIQAVGLATTHSAASPYAAMKSGPVLRVIIDPANFRGLDATHEIGGSGHDQFLLRPLSGASNWPGLPLLAIS